MSNFAVTIDVEHVKMQHNMKMVQNSGVPKKRVPREVSDRFSEGTKFSNGDADANSKSLATKEAMRTAFLSLYSEAKGMI